VDGSGKEPLNGMDDLPDATRRFLADFLSMSARSARDSETLAQALRDSLALSALHAAGEFHRNAKGAGVAASPLN
jgi:hypothetical protein